MGLSRIGGIKVTKTITQLKTDIEIAKKAVRCAEIRAAFTSVKLLSEFTTEDKAAAFDRIYEMLLTDMEAAIKRGYFDDALAYNQQARIIELTVGRGYYALCDVL